MAYSVLVIAAGFYPDNGPVKEITGKSFKREVLENSDHLSVVEFYAPWCGHCQTLKSEYSKAAKSSLGIVDYLAVNCDDDSNKPLCQRYQVQGFPTIKLFRPRKGTNSKQKPEIEDYQGERKAKPLTEFAFSKMPNQATVVTSRTVDKFLSEDTTRVVLMAGKKKKAGAGMPPLFKALSSEFSTAKFGYVPESEVESMAGKFNFASDERDPSAAQLLVIHGDEHPIVYDGEMKKTPISDFLTSHLSNTEHSTAAKASSTTSGTSNKRRRLVEEVNTRKAGDHSPQPKEEL